jgi:hypothetical protein
MRKRLRCTCTIFFDDELGWKIVCAKKGERHEYEQDTAKHSRTRSWDRPMSNCSAWRRIPSLLTPIGPSPALLDEALTWLA